MYWYLKVLKQYFDFKGRARRKEYWFYSLFNCIFSLILIGIDFLLFPSIIKENGIFPLQLIYSLIVMIPGIAVSVRRFHDIDRSGWWLLIALIPIVNIIFLFWMLYCFVQEGTNGSNRFGENPKGI